MLCFHVRARVRTSGEEGYNAIELAALRGDHRMIDLMVMDGGVKATSDRAVTIIRCAAARFAASRGAGSVVVCCQGGSGHVVARHAPARHTAALTLCVCRRCHYPVAMTPMRRNHPLSLSLISACVIRSFFRSFAH
jgi:hypothetical protein